MKKLCIFDFDGTLFDTLPDVVKCFNKTFESLGYETLTTEFYTKSLGGNINEIISLILKEDNSTENIQKVKEIYERLYANDLKENSKMFEGVLELLEKLQEENYILAVNSNRTPDSIKKFISEYAGNIEFIDIQGHVDNNPSKPDPYGVNVILQKSQVTKNDCVYIGDSITDIKTAMNAGIDCILVRWGYGVGNVYEHEYPIAVVDKAEEIYDIIKNIQI